MSEAQAPKSPALLPKESEETEDPQARAKACMAELQELLEKHRCQIIPKLESLPVGYDGTVQISPRWDLAAMVDK